jgi:hypothetical protein
MTACYALLLFNPTVSSADVACFRPFSHKPNVQLIEILPFSVRREHLFSNRTLVSAATGQLSRGFSGGTQT